MTSLGRCAGPVVINADTGDAIQLGNYKGWLTNANDISENGVVVGRWADGIGEDQNTYQAVDPSVENGRSLLVQAHSPKP